ncbi:tetratricopeptide repeat protein [Azospirillum brasilense]|uniref:tetratricopeptide repeat protein n=1 Tax=Azospirillum brasilense TaxID=192 RepID=UPI001FFFEC2A|nr:tetratricopeptide repeat protein [Azospirillum brasilense]
MAGIAACSTEGPGIIDVQLALGQQCLDRGGADRARAVEWFRIAARSGDARAVNMLGRCHEHGWGVPADPVLAAAHYRRAADLGDAWALFNLADLHCRGLGVPADDAEASRLYAAAARRGNVKALNMLGLFHESGWAAAWKSWRAPPPPPAPPPPAPSPPPPRKFSALPLPPRE